MANFYTEGPITSPISAENIEARGNDKGKGGWTKTDNLIWDYLARVNMSETERRVLAALIRKLHGWHKDADYISRAQLMEATGIPYRRRIEEALSGLEARGIIRMEAGGKGRGNTRFIELRPVEEWQEKATLRGHFTDEEKATLRGHFSVKKRAFSEQKNARVGGHTKETEIVKKPSKEIPAAGLASTQTGSAAASDKATVRPINPVAGRMLAKRRIQDALRRIRTAGLPDQAGDCQQYGSPPNPDAVIGLYEEWTADVSRQVEESKVRQHRCLIIAEVGHPVFFAIPERIRNHLAAVHAAGLVTTPEAASRARELALVWGGIGTRGKAGLPAGLG